MLHVREVVMLAVPEMLPEPVRVDERESDIVCEEVSDALLLVVGEVERLKLAVDEAVVVELRLRESLKVNVPLEDFD